MAQRSAGTVLHSPKTCERLQNSMDGMKEVAQGQPKINSDTIVFRHGEEVFELPTYGVVGNFAHYNGVFYEAKVKDIRKFIRKHRKFYG